MGLFDRIKGSEEEVEIRPAERREEGYDFSRSEGSTEDEAENEFILPGMKAASSESTSRNSTSRDSASSRSSSRSSRDGVERIVKQNERIIELLEEIAGSDSDTDSVL